MAFQDYALLTESFMEHMKEVAKNSGVDPDIVHWSGSVSVMEGQEPVKNVESHLTL